MAGCALCERAGGELLVQSADWRVVLADEPEARAFPGFTRVIWQAHRREMTELEPAARASLMQVVFQIEALQREHLQPDKINLASLGNQVAHVHWHIIPRWSDDSHFPRPVWAAAQSGRAARAVAPDLLRHYREAVVATLGGH